LAAFGPGVLTAAAGSIRVYRSPAIERRKPASRVVIDRSPGLIGKRCCIDVKVVRVTKADGTVEETPAKQFGSRLARELARAPRSDRTADGETSFTAAYARHPTDITSRAAALVMEQLGLSPNRIDELKGKIVVSIGEGFSDFAQTLERRGVKVVATDLLYGRSKQQLNQLWIMGGRHGTDPLNRLPLAEALQRLPRNRVGANALRLPFRDHSVEAVYDANLFYWLTPLQQCFALVEYMRVLKPGGELRVVAWPLHSRVRSFAEKKWPGLVVSEGHDWLALRAPQPQ
jgi:hypothetical protein